AQADWQWAQDQEALVREAAAALIEQSRGELRSARHRLQLAEADLLPAAERLAVAAEAAWARGGSSLLELIEARRALRAARLEVLTARAEAAKATWRWQSLDTP
ncbi:MAG: multidrug transporter, partial [Betaproteobacteria bacterium]|nr:multidrug transporter [Betaproteobacteria bacterium]